MDNEICAVIDRLVEVGVKIIYYEATLVEARIVCEQRNIDVSGTPSTHAIRNLEHITPHAACASLMSQAMACSYIGGALGLAVDIDIKPVSRLLEVEYGEDSDRVLQNTLQALPVMESLCNTVDRVYTSILRHLDMM
jgi:hypothetical protein